MVFAALFIILIIGSIVIKYKQQQKSQAQLDEEKRFRALYGEREYTNLQHSHSYHHTRYGHPGSPKTGEFNAPYDTYNDPTISMPAPFQPGYSGSYGGADLVSRSPFYYLRT